MAYTQKPGRGNGNPIMKVSDKLKGDSGLMLLGDLDKDGTLNKYEAKRQAAIVANTSPASMYGAPIKMKTNNGPMPQSGLNYSTPLQHTAGTPGHTHNASGDLNKTIYEAKKTLASIKADPLGKNQSTSTELPTFRYRGKDAFAQSLKDDKVIQPSFTDQGDNSRYKYLSSRFNINPTINDPMQQNNLRNHGAPTGSNISRNTIAQDIKNKQDNDAKYGYSGVKETLKEANQGAKVSANISKNLQTAKATGSESNLKSAIETARTDMRNDKFLRSTRPVRTNPRTGKTEISNQAAYLNARTVQDYINQSQTATKRQNSADNLRFMKDDFDKDVKSGKYKISTPKKKDERSGN